MPSEEEVSREGGLPKPEDAVFGEQMRAALHRLEAPDGFTDRLMTRVAIRERTSRAAGETTGGNRGKLLQFTGPAWRAIYAAAAVLAITAGAVHVEHVRADRHQADIAAAQLDTAMAVTTHALDHVTAKLETTEFGQLQRALQTDEGGR